MLVQGLTVYNSFTEFGGDCIMLVEGLQHNLIMILVWKAGRNGGWAMAQGQVPASLLMTEVR